MEGVRPRNVAAGKGAAGLRHDTAVGDIEYSIVCEGRFLNDTLRGGTQIENIGAWGTGEVGIREGESPAAGIRRVEADARRGSTVCLNEPAAIVGGGENVCYRSAVGGETAHPGHAPVERTAGNDKDKTGVDPAEAGGDVTAFHRAVTPEHPTARAKNPH